MIAEVYPFLKLPRRFSVFDYKIPADLSIRVGDVVYTSFRGRAITAVVRSIKTTSDAKKLSMLNGVLCNNWCSEQDLMRFETIAASLAQSVSSLLYYLPKPSSGNWSTTRQMGSTGAAISTPTSRSVQKTDAEIVTSILKAINELPHAGYLAVNADKEIGAILTHLLRKKTARQVLILLPRERDADLLIQAISLGAHVAVLHGKTPERDREAIATAWRSGQVRTLVSTRQGALLPAHNLEYIIVLDAGSEDHLNARRNPRFDARAAAKLLAKQHGAKLICMDDLPRLEELITPTNDLRLKTNDFFSPSVVNLRNRLEFTHDPLVSESLIESMKNALQNRKKVLLFLNRKGVAKRLQCGACGHLPLCGNCGNLPTVRVDDLICDRCHTEMWIPETCPECGQKKIKLRGIGGASVEAALAKLFPDHSIARIEKGSPKSLAADIIIATEYFFSSILPLFPPKEFGLVADLMTDVGLYGEDFRGSEKTARKIHRLVNFAKRQDAYCLLQTWLPDIITPMLNLEGFITSELDLRKKYQLPPFTSRILLEKTALADLPDSLRPFFSPHGNYLESRNLRLKTNDLRLSSLPDRIKLTFDGPYVLPQSAPQS